MDRSMVCRHDHCFVDRSIILVAEALFCPSLTGALLWLQEHCFVDRSMVLSTGAMFCRPEHRFIDRSMSIGVLWLWLFRGRSTVLSQSDRSIVLSVGSLFCRQEHGFVDRINAMSTGACLLSTGACPQEHCGVDKSIVLSA